MTSTVAVDKIFESRSHDDKTFAIKIKVLKKLSSSKFLIGDATGTCIMKIDSNFQQSDILTESKCYQIHYEKSNIEENTLVLRENVKILESSWKVFVPVAIIAKANIDNDVEKVNFHSLTLKIYFLYVMLACMTVGRESGGSKH